METNGLLELFGGLFPIIFVIIVITIAITNIRKANKIKKLKSGELSSKVITGTVNQIKYNTGGKNNQGIIVSRYFIAKGINLITNEEIEFKSDNFPYKDSIFKIRWMGPNEEDINKLLEYARTFVKEGDTVKIHISIENQNIYYIEDITQKGGESIEKDGDISELITFSQNTINTIRKNPDTFMKSGFGDIIKKIRIFGIAMVLLFVGLPTLVMFIQDGNGISINMPKLDIGMKVNFGGGYIIRSILALLIAFIIYKIIVGYRGIKK